MEESEPLAEPDPAFALWAGSLDQMVDQVTRSVAFVQRRYPSNKWVSRQRSSWSDDCGGSGGGSPSGPGSRGHSGTPRRWPEALGNLNANPSLLCIQGNLPVWTLSRGPAGRHVAPGELDGAWSPVQLQRSPWGPHHGWAASPPPRARGSVLAAGSPHRRAGLAYPRGSWEQGHWLLFSLLRSRLPGCGARTGRLLPAWCLREAWPEWRDGPTCPADHFTFAAFFLLSGIYDLEPFIHTSDNAPLLLTL